VLYTCVLYGHEYRLIKVLIVIYHIDYIIDFIFVLFGTFFAQYLKPPVCQEMPYFILGEVS
jgi:hypothetical protein